MTKKKPFNFENTITNLTTIVENLESGDLSLEDSLKDFESGIGLTRKAQQAIEEAEQSVQLLLQDGKAPAGPKVESFIEEDESNP